MGEITYPFSNCNGCTIEVWEWIRNFISNFTINVITITYPCWDYSETILVKGAQAVDLLDSIYEKKGAPGSDVYGRQATGLDAYASRVKCPARFVSHLHEIFIYIWVVYSFCLFCCLFIIVTWWYIWCIVSQWQARESTGMFGNLMAIYYIMPQFIQNHSRFVMLMKTCMIS